MTERTEPALSDFNPIENVCTWCGEPHDVNVSGFWHFCCTDHSIDYINWRAATNQYG